MGSGGGGAQEESLRGPRVMGLGQRGGQGQGGQGPDDSVQSGNEEIRAKMSVCEYLCYFFFIFVVST